MPLSIFFDLQVFLNHLVDLVRVSNNRIWNIRKFLIRNRGQVVRLLTQSEVVVELIAALAIFSLSLLLSWGIYRSKIFNVFFERAL